MMLCLFYEGVSRGFVRIDLGFEKSKQNLKTCNSKHPIDSVFSTSRTISTTQVLFTSISYLCDLIVLVVHNHIGSIFFFADNRCSMLLLMIRIPLFGEFTCQNAVMAERFIEAGSAYVSRNFYLP